MMARRNGRPNRPRGNGNGNGNGNGGGNGGGGGGGNNQVPWYVQQAQAMVMPSYIPQLQAIRRATQQGLQQYKQLASNQAQIYPALDSSLAAIGNTYNTNTAPLAGQLADQINTLPGTMANTVGVVPDAEKAAGLNNLGAIGFAGESNLTSERLRNMGYNASTRRQGAVEKATLAKNAVTDVKNFLTDMRNKKLDVTGQIPAAIQAASLQIKQQAFNNHMSMLSYKLSKQQVTDQEAQFAAAQAAAAATNRLYARIFFGKDPNHPNEPTDPTDPKFGTDTGGPGGAGGGFDTTTPGSGSAGSPGGYTTGPNGQQGQQGGLPTTGDASAVGSWITFASPAELQANAQQMALWLQQQGLPAYVTPDGTITVRSYTGGLPTGPGDALYVLHQFNDKLTSGVNPT